MYYLIVNGLNSDDKFEEEIRTVKEVFNIAGKELEVRRTTHAGHAKEIAAELTANGNFAHLIAMGGDGTLHEVLNGIEDIRNCTLGLIPHGTGNDFAEICRIPKTVKEAAQTIAFRAPTNIDYIETESGLRSINIIGTGIDVDTLVNRNCAGKKKSYASAFLQTLRSYKPINFMASWDDEEERIYTGFIACLGNGRQFGGGIKICPDAKIDDGYIDLLIVKYISKIKLLGALVKLAAGKVYDIKEATYVKCKSVRITPIGDKLPTIQAEGELYDNIPLHAHIVEGQLKFYLPSSIDN